MKSRTRQSKNLKPALLSSQLHTPKITTIKEHVAELRRRLFYVVLSVGVWSAAAYFVMHPIIDILLEPSHGQKFIYTTPIGGMNFLFKVCLYVGIMFSIPVIVYHFLRYIEPLMQKASARFIAWGSIASGILAVAGMVFGYFFGLPAALHFLLNQFITSQVSPLLTIEAYLSFVTMYMLGAALMFQIPLIVLFINRIKPLKPSGLFKAERWVIISTVVLAFVMNPTPSLYDQLLLAVPMILSYQMAIGIVWLVNRRQHQLQHMRQADRKAQAHRQERVQALTATWQAATELANQAEAGQVAARQLAPAPTTRLQSPRPARPMRQDIISRPVVRRPIVAPVTRPRPLRSGYIQ